MPYTEEEREYLLARLHFFMTVGPDEMFPSQPINARPAAEEKKEETAPQAASR
jgi:hypothetical protein